MGSIGRWRDSNSPSHSQLTISVIFTINWLLCSFFVSDCAGNFNLYLNTEEVKRTLGKFERIFLLLVYLVISHLILHIFIQLDIGIRRQ